jgi:hypothetical protein
VTDGKRIVRASTKMYICSEVVHGIYSVYKQDKG